MRLTNHIRSCKSPSAGLSSRHFFPPFWIYKQCGSLQNSIFLLNQKDVSQKNMSLNATLITRFEQKKNNWKLFSDLRTEFNKKFKSKKNHDSLNLMNFRLKKMIVLFKKRKQLTIDHSTEAALLRVRDDYFRFCGCIKPFRFFLQIWQ